MTRDYAVLAPHYQRIGLAEFATKITPKLVNYAQQKGWMGRRILDLGCGTGTSLLWLAGHGYSTTGVDNSPEMLRQARQVMEAGSLHSTLVEGE